MINIFEDPKDILKIIKLENDDLSNLKGDKSAWIQYLMEINKNDQVFIFAKILEDKVINYIVVLCNINLPVASSIVIAHIANEEFIDQLLDQTRRLKKEKKAFEILIESTDNEALERNGFVKFSSVFRLED